MNNSVNNNILNIFLPSREELLKESIYLNGQQVPLANIQDQFTYELPKSDINLDKLLTLYQTSLNQTPNEIITLSQNPLFQYYQSGSWDASAISDKDLGTISLIVSEEFATNMVSYHDGKIDTAYLDAKMNSLCQNLAVDAYKPYITQPILTFFKGQNKNEILSTLWEFLEQILDIPEPKNISLAKNVCNTVISEKKRSEIWKDLKGQYVWDIYNEIKNINTELGTYTLKYAKDTYTAEEAHKFLSENPLQAVTEESWSGNLIVKNGNSAVGSMTNQCINILYDGNNNYRQQTECTLLMGAIRNITLTLSAYETDNLSYPEDLKKLVWIYMQELPDNPEMQYISYKQTDNGKWYELSYVENARELAKSQNTGESQTETKKDYNALLEWKTVPEMPEIFTHIPNDSMMLYVKNPDDMWNVLTQPSGFFQEMSGIKTAKTIQNFLATFFGYEDFADVRSKIKHEFALVVTNLDVTAPEYILILSEEDAGAFRNDQTQYATTLKDGFLYISRSQKALDTLLATDSAKTIPNSPDFRYVWTKKESMIHGTFVFVGDAFFEKIISLEFFTSHARKLRDYHTLVNLQELVWAYERAFWSFPKSFDDIETVGFGSFPSDIKDNFTLAENGIVTEKHIGSLANLHTLSDTAYDMNNFSRDELETYKYEVLKYREIWRNTLDPMSIILNKHGDGFDIDFFMTPLPSFEDSTMKELVDFIKVLGKENLSFLTNPKLRIGLFSAVFGIDAKKLQETIAKDRDIQEGFQELSTYLGGKNIFDYIGGEIALSLGDIDNDIFEGFNVEKIDAFLSLQVTSEGKGKELIELLKSQALKQFGNSGTDGFLQNILSKPLIEDYNGKKIYYRENIAVPFVGNIGIAYTFIDDFFVLGLNRATIRKAIDTANKKDLRKSELISPTSFEKNTIFATIFDGETLQKTLSGFVNNTSAQSSMLNYIREDEPAQRVLSLLAGKYYAGYERSEKLEKTTRPFLYTLGNIAISGKWENISIRMNKSNTGEIISPDAEKLGWYQGKDIPLTEFLSHQESDAVIASTLLSELSHENTSLLKNMTFWVSLTEDEIGFRFAMFQKQENTSERSIVSEMTKYIGFGILLFLIILSVIGGGTLYKRQKQKPQAAESIPENTNTPGVPPTTNNNSLIEMPSLHEENHPDPLWNPQDNSFQNPL